MRCHAWKGRRGSVRCGCRHGRMMEAYDLAVIVWTDQAEAATSQYGTELQQYREDNPVPHLSDFMKGSF